MTATESALLDCIKQLSRCTKALLGQDAVQILSREEYARDVQVQAARLTAVRAMRNETGARN